MRQRLRCGAPALTRPGRLCEQENAKRLKAYKANLILFPRRSGKPKARAHAARRRFAARLPAHADSRTDACNARSCPATLQAGDSAAEVLSVAQQLKAKLQPISKAAPKIESVKVTTEMQAAKAYATLRLERMNARLVGIRAKKAAELEKEKEAAAK
jgi:large subunit ribosomal protein L13e